VDKKLKGFLEQMQIGGKHEHDALAVLTNEVTGRKRYIWGRNIVTDAGDVYYAQKACGESATNTFANLYLATGGPSTPGKTDNYGSFTGVTGEKAKSSGYPKTNDDDSDNTGKTTDTVSWKFEYITSDGPYTSITHSFIAKASATGTDPILNSYKWGASWSKDTSTSCKVFANHTMNGT
jgi:hypothetical protein